MGVDGIGSPGLGKTLRSLRDALGSLEREIEFIMTRVQAGSSRLVFEFARRLAASISGDSLLLLARGVRANAPGIDVTKLISTLSSSFDVSAISGALGKFLGFADIKSLEALQREILVLLDELGIVRDREIATSGGLTQLKARSGGFEDALTGLARLQGRMIARLDAQVGRTDAVERLAISRDDHITRLIRDTAAQRAELERVERRFAEADSSDRELARRLDLVEVENDGSETFGRIEAQIGDLKRLQKSGIQSAIESLDSLRDRVGRLEARAAEMSREARAKTGRLDALARHVASVEGRLTSAIGKGGGNVVTVAARKIEDFEGKDGQTRHAGTP